MDRNREIVKTSIIGIVVNLLLAGFKAAVGLLSGAIAITLDAVNNLSDSLSSVVTIVGAKLAGKKPDKKHPYGHGRVEYISASIIAAIILYAGVTSFIESVKAIITPSEPDHTPVGLIIIAVAVLVKVALGLYVQRTGKKVHSTSLIASGKDALLDSLVSLATLVAALLFLIFHINVEAWLAAVISLLLIKTGIEILAETVGDIIGRRADPELANKIRETVLHFPEVRGIYDLVLHNYGPDHYMGSFHIEVDDTMSVAELDHLEREIADRVYTEDGVITVGISVYSHNTQGDAASEMREEIRRRVMAHEFVLQFHGFYVNEAEKNLRFDIVVDFAAPDRSQVCSDVVNEIQALYPDYQLSVVLDSDIS